MIMEHNSAQCRYRSPLGAVPAGTSVMLRLRAEGGEVRSVRIKTFFYADSAEYAMENHGRYWEKRLTVPDDIGVLWYFFLIETPQETL